MTGREESTFAIRRVTGTRLDDPALLVDIEDEMNATTPVGTFGGGLLVNTLVKGLPLESIPVEVKTTGRNAGGAVGGAADGKLGGIVRRLVVG
jgi:hypothetical protein